MRGQTTVVLFCIVALLTTGGQARSGRIVGGYDAELGQFLYQASLKVAETLHLCGATIISQNYVVTAAHCLDSAYPEYVQVLVGTYNLLGGQAYEVAQFIPHPEYDGFTMVNDIGLVETQTIIVFGLNVQPIAIGSADDVIGAGVIGRATGWGAVNVSSKIAFSWFYKLPQSIYHIILRIDWSPCIGFLVVFGFGDVGSVGLSI